MLFGHEFNFLPLCYAMLNNEETLVEYECIQELKLYIVLALHFDHRYKINVESFDN